MKEELKRAIASRAKAVRKAEDAYRRKSAKASRHLKALRKRSGIPLRDLAEEIGCSHSTLWDLEEGKRPLTLVRYNQIFNAITICNGKL